ncbi:aspartate/glutamate racemase family protein [Vibrio superstes]|uniref:Arylsulfatase n=1 Tax=Vibrio superstes NBRC 103154 TaxID=1219062 RepID=A0A511QKW4_9VIBR|nr:aspartate/glutamate racemase family protein [Vibrio superstes]GEM77974.1 arylsulfatase [Vibrio superstes NBRC 103154]
MKIALIHAVDIAIEPIKRAFENEWQDAEIVHLWDQTLSTERAKTDALTPFLYQRVNSLYELARDADVDAVMFTCSAFGEAIEALAMRSDIPVLKPNQAMFQQALELNKPIAMLGTFEPAMQGMIQEFHQQGEETVQLETLCSPEARAALNQGDLDAHNQLLLQKVKSLNGIDAVMLAHFSSSVAKSLIEQETQKTVLSSPECAVRYLKRVLCS